MTAANKYYQDMVKAGGPEQAAKQKIKIKVASNLYEEQTLKITIPGIVIEPKEKGGEVTLLQELAPCIIVDVGAGNTVTIKNTRLLMKASPQMKDEHAERTFKKQPPGQKNQLPFGRLSKALEGSPKNWGGSEKKSGHTAVCDMHVTKESMQHPAVQGFNTKDMVALVILKSGTLNMQGCSLSVETVQLNNIYKSKIPCFYQKPDTISFITKCQFRGGGEEKAESVGIYN